MFVYLKSIFIFILFSFLLLAQSRHFLWPAVSVYDRPYDTKDFTLTEINNI